MAACLADKCRIFLVLYSPSVFYKSEQRWWRRLPFLPCLLGGYPELHAVRGDAA